MRYGIQYGVGFCIQYGVTFVAALLSLWHPLPWNIVFSAALHLVQCCIWCGVVSGAAFHLLVTKVVLEWYSRQCHITSNMAQQTAQFEGSVPLWVVWRSVPCAALQAQCYRRSVAGAV